MPVRSLTSSVLRWPDPEAVRAAIRSWSADVGGRPGVLRVGCFGSLATGGWGVGSDVDLVLIVETSDQPPARRSLAFDTLALPVSADLLVYTAEEWSRLIAGGRDPIGPVEWLGDA